jgi:hypothetical protein
MAKNRNQSLVNNVRSAFGQFGGSRRDRSRSSGGGLASQASGFIGGLLSGDDDNKSRSRGRRRR